MILNKEIAEIKAYLTSQKFLYENEEMMELEIPGDGNMNFTLRVITSERSFIMKQSRGYVEKYPQVLAPADRCLREADFYQLISSIPSLSVMTPKILLVNTENHILVMEDLGQASDFSFLYHTEGTIEDKDLKDIMEFAATLHTSVTKHNADFLVSNRSMRKLNHEHIYIYPYLADNGLNLDDVCVGLSEVALQYKNDENLKSIVNHLGDQYLSDGDVLVHGDYFPGSWLKTSDGIKIIDPEFCHFGSPEFEIGVTVAHLIFARQSDELIEKSLAYYTQIAPLNRDQVMQHAGVEIIRRILGLAQLPITTNLSQRTHLLERAYSFITNQKTL